MYRWALGQRAWAPDMFFLSTCGVGRGVDVGKHARFLFCGELFDAGSSLHKQILVSSKLQASRQFSDCVEAALD